MSRLAKIIASGKIPHAMLFCGKRDCKLQEVAKQFAVDLIGKHLHPDVHDYFPEGKTKMHAIQTLRGLTEAVGFVPYQAPYKLFFIHDAEAMLPTSSNALLKTLEEPTERTVIVLLSYHPEHLLPTILSRCQRLDFSSLQVVTVKHKIIEVLARKEPLESIEGDEQIEELLETIVLWYRDRMLIGIQGSEPYLSYPEYREEIAQTTPIPLDRLEKLLAQVRLGYERSIKLTTCLETLITYV